MIIELKYEGSADEALAQTQKYFPLFKDHKKVQTVKSLGIKVSQDKTTKLLILDIKTKLQDNPNCSVLPNWTRTSRLQV